MSLCRVAGLNEERRLGVFSDPGRAALRMRAGLRAFWADAAVRGGASARALQDGGGRYSRPGG